MPDGEKHEIPMYQPVIGPKALDGQYLHKKTGMFTYDPGFTSTASCVSQITYIDGEKGQLLYRGYSIDKLAENCTFLETCFLLLYGDLPNKEQLDVFEEKVMDEMLVHERIKDFYKGFESNAHPMAIMCGVVGALAQFFNESMDIKDPKQRENTAIKLIAKFPTLAAISFRTSKGLPLVQPDKRKGYTENFLYMLFSDPMDPSFEIPSVMVEALDKILILHADHEQNASTSTVRLTGSSLCNPFACISAGIASLWGPAHGGANEACLQMLDQIGNKENIPKYVVMAKDKNNSFRIMGFGHRVYKNMDPRATEMQKMCHRVLNELDCKDEDLFELAMELEKVALSDEYFIKRKLYPNVDFYSGIVLQALKIPRDMFTVIFSLARTIGWIC
jgi:citrate synthase